MFVRGLGTALAGMPLMAAALVSIDAVKGSDATAQLFVLQRVGGSLGTALFIVVLERTTSFGTTYAVVAAVTALSLIPCIALAGSEKRRRLNVPIPVPAA
jgi:hypothetical protein